MWSRAWGGPGKMYAFDVASTPQGRLVVAGIFEGSLVIDGQAVGCDDCHGGIVVVLAGDGSLVWHHLIPTNTLDMNTFAVPGSLAQVDFYGSVAFAADGAAIVADHDNAPFDLLGPYVPVGEVDVWITRVTVP